MNAPATCNQQDAGANLKHYIAMIEATNTVLSAPQEIKFTEKNIRNFWAKVNKNGPTQAHMDTPCWVWTAGKRGNGYGAFSVRRKQLMAHRISWMISNGPIPHDGSHHGICVCHQCDNPICCRPDHLFLGTVGDNARDRSSKGRSNSPRGEIHGMVKLTASQVVEIRAIYASGAMNHRELGLRFNVSREAIGVIIRRKKWAHI